MKFISHVPQDPPAMGSTKSNGFSLKRTVLEMTKRLSDARVIPPATSRRKDKELGLGVFKNQVEARASELNDQVFSLQTSLRQALADYDYAKADCLFETCKVTLRIHQLLRDLVGQLDQVDDDTPVFVIGSLLLAEAYRTLKSVQTETIIYASGYRFGRYRSVERIVPLPLDRSEATYARGDISATGQILIEMDRFGAALTAHLHMHPMNGLHGNVPSSVDRAQQDRLENGGHQAVGLIFTRDGYIRFYSQTLKYAIAITGKGVERVDNGLYRLLEM